MAKENHLHLPGPQLYLSASALVATVPKVAEDDLLSNLVVRVLSSSFQFNRFRKP